MAPLIGPARGMLVLALALLPAARAGQHVLIVGDSMAEYENCPRGVGGIYNTEYFGTDTIKNKCAGASSTNAGIGSSKASEWTAASCTWQVEPNCPNYATTSTLGCSFASAFALSSGYTLVWLSVGANDFMDTAGCAMSQATLTSTVTNTLNALRTAASAAGYPTIPVVMTGYASPTEPGANCLTVASLAPINNGIKAACDADAYCTFVGTADDASYLAGGTSTSFSPTTYMADQYGHMNLAGYNLWAERSAWQAAFGCDSDDDGLSTTDIIIIVSCTVGGSLLIAAAVFGVWWFKCRKPTADPVKEIDMPQQQ